MKKAQLVIIDDQKINTKILTKLLESDFEIIVGHDANDCLKLIKEYRPDALLLDIVLPKITGLRICSEIKKTQKFEKLPIIFVSSLSSSQDQVNGYEAGCDEYIVKPFPEKELLIKKIHNVIANRHFIEEIQDDAFFSKQVAKTALTEASEIGELHQLSLSLMSIFNKEKMIETVLQYFTHNRLIAIIYMKYDQKSDYFSNGKKIGELDKTVIETKEVKGRFFDFGFRTLFDFENIKILVKNMPIRDERCAQIKDNILMLCSIINQRINLIEKEVQIKEISKSAFKLAKVIYSSIHETNIQNHELLSSLKHEIIDTFDDLLLTEEQENYLTSVFDNASNKSDEIIVNQDSVRHMMEELLEGLKITNSEH